MTSPISTGPADGWERQRRPGLGRTSHRAVGAPALLGAAAAWVVLLYRPWYPAPFSVLDFTEFLPLLRRHATFGARLSALLEYYASQGRFNVLQYVGLVAKWSWLGNDPVAWQVIRVCQMLAIVVGAAALLRRLGVGSTAAASGGALFLISTAGISAFTRLTMGEPLGVCFILAAALLASNYQETTHWIAYTLAIAAAIAGTVLAKEMLVLAVPFVVLLACCYRGGGRWSVRPQNSRRNGMLVAAVCVTVAFLAVPIVYTLRHSRLGSFGSGYGRGGVSPGRVIDGFARFALPFASIHMSTGRALLVPANVVYVVLIATGLGASIRRGSFQPLPWIAAALLPVCAALLYAPWLASEDFYALPCLIGDALLLGLAIDALAGVGRQYVPTLLILGGYAFLSASEQAYNSAQLQWAIRVVDGEIARLLALTPPQRSAALARPVGTFSRFRESQWLTRGPSLSRYAAAASGHRVPVLIELTCDEAAPLLRASNLIVVTYGSPCAFGAPPTFAIHARVAEWNGFRRDYGFVTADLWWPPPLPPSGALRTAP